MSTRSYICVKQDDGSYKGVYCHWDGYLTYNGAMLIDHYNSLEKANEILALGDISSLKENLYPDPARTLSIMVNSRKALLSHTAATAAKQAPKPKPSI